MNNNKITLLRHAHTKHNGPPKIFQGRLDVSISEAGKQQCIDARDQFKWVTHITASPAKRVRESLHYLLGERLNDIEVSFDDDLWEIDNGWFSGMSEGEVKKKDPELYQQWCDAPHNCRPGGGETLNEMQTRALAAISRIKEFEKNSGNTLVATHGGIIRVLKLHYKNLPLSEFHRLDVKNLDTFTLP